MGLTIFLFGVFLALPRHLLPYNEPLLAINEAIVWYSGVPIVLGLALALVDLLILLAYKRPARTDVRFDTVADPKLIVALTAYDHEASIGAAVRDFIEHPQVSHVIVVSNNSPDNTMQQARAAGAIVFNEMQQGYGRCVYRCLQEALAYPGDLVLLCEGDRTFRAYDIAKLLAYIPHADIVNGTRTVEKLLARSTQLRAPFKTLVRRRIADS